MPGRILKPYTTTLKITRVAIQPFKFIITFLGAIHTRCRSLCLDFSFQVMAGAQEQLRDAWLGGAEGCLCAREQALAWALCKVWLKDNKDKPKPEYGMFSFVASKVRKTKKGKPVGAHPTSEAMQQFYTKVNNDPEWFPGKHVDTKRGPEPVLKGGKKTGIIQAAKRIKREGGDVTAPKIIGRARQATLNPATNEPVDKKLIYNVLREVGVDTGDPNDCWDLRPRLSRQALDEKQIVKRFAWAKWMKHVVAHTSAWYFLNLVWCDLCNSILPKTERVAGEQSRARKADRFWGSKKEQKHSANLRGSKKSIKMKSTDTIRVWFVPILARGKFHIEPLPENFPGETAEGAAIMVAKVRAALNIRFPGGDTPRMLFTDRGNGFFESGSGAITTEYRNALLAHNLKAFMGYDASMQPGSLQEIMLHETLMAWVRHRLANTVPKFAEKESVSEYITRLKHVATYINENYDVEGVSQELNDRVDEVLAARGDRIP